MEFDTVTASVMMMHHVLSVLTVTFIQSWKYEVFEYFTTNSITDQSMPITFADSMFMDKVWFVPVWRQRPSLKVKTTMYVCMYMQHMLPYDTGINLYAFTQYV